jgi:pentatricopeptide repeat protein
LAQAGKAPPRDRRRSASSAGVGGGGGSAAASLAAALSSGASPPAPAALAAAAASARREGAAGADAAWRLVEAAQARGVPLEARTLSELAAACSRGSGWDAFPRTRAVHAALCASGAPHDAFALSALVSAASRCGAVEDAFAAEAAARQAGAPRDPVVWNALLAACARAGQAERCAALFDEGVADGLTPDAATLAPLVAALAQAGQPERALATLDAAVARFGIRSTPRLACAAVAACGVAGDAAGAWRAFSAVPRPDAALLTALIDACGRAGDADGAMRAFLQGDAAGVPLARHEPALCAVMAAFARARAPDRALRFYHTVARAWPAQRPPESVLRLLRDAASAAGDVAVAQEAAALLAARASAAGTKPGAPRDADAAPRRKPGAAVASFASAGREWRTANGDGEDDADAERLLRGAGRDLVAALEGAGPYRIDTSCVLLMAGGEEAQRDALACHAEKKALGALLLRAPQGEAAPRVKVSIRMCRCCHGAFAAASAHFQQRIECFDGHEHRFENGVCSCGGRWR